ncbi:hypothetical protein LTR85_009367 [Meristemomyces frigidus]|nr:hypothetical protein LTR85_009367 [Meristemomyces frigidus]
MVGQPGLVTPGKERSTAHFDLRLQDSPFSDYFTDDARSVDNTAGGASYDAPSSETQQLLVRLSKLQAHLMRGGEDERDVLNIVGRRMGEIDTELDALHSQTRLPADLEDSGLFMDDEVDEGLSEHAPAAPPGSHGYDRASEHGVTPENRRAELDYQLLEAQRVLENVTKAQEELRKRHAELVQRNDTHVLLIEEREQEAERLRSENETLKSDLGFDHSELLFLKLQMKALEIEIDTSQAEDSELAQISEAGQAGIKRVKRGKVLEDMEHWRSDWHDVDARLKRRRSKYGGELTVDCRRDRNHKDDAIGIGGEEGGEWRLETIEAGRGGRVSSITIRRHDSLRSSNPPAFGLDGAADEQQYNLDKPASAMAEDRGCQTETAQRPIYTERESQTDLDVEPVAEYAEQSTQTEMTALPAWKPRDLVPSEQEQEQQGSYGLEYDDGDDDDCAVTTSASTAESSPVIQPLDNKSPWAELWEGLGHLAGMGEEI